MNYDREDNMKAIQYATVLAAAIIGLAVGGCTSMGDWFRKTVEKAGEAMVVTNAPAGQYVSQWKLDPVDGNKASDKGEEIVGFIGSADYRFLANDSKGDGYFMSGVVKKGSAFSWEKVPNGWKVSAKDFTSDQSGKNYKWVGFRVQTSTSAMLTDNPLQVSEQDMKKSFRTYWQTVSGKGN